MISSDQSNQVVIRFTVTEGDHSYSDALYFTPEEYAAQTPDTIAAMQQARFNNWRAIVTAPPVEQTPEMLQAQIDSLTQQQRDTQAQLLAIAPDDVMLPILQEQASLIAGQIAALTPVVGA